MKKYLFYELEKAGLSVKQQIPVPIIYDNKKFEGNFRIDLLINDLVIIEIKSVDCLGPLHSKQLLTYLKLTGKKLGLLINFNCLKMDKNNIVRLIY